MDVVEVPARQQAVGEMMDQLGRMGAGEAAAGVPAGMRGLEGLARDAMSRWEAEPDGDGFYFYYAARTVARVLAVMRERLAGGADAGTARDVLALVPVIDGALRAAEAREITGASTDAVIDRLRIMWEATRNTDFAAPPEDGTDGAGWRALHENAVPLARYLGIEPEKEHGDDD